ncbi:DUF228 domain-containing protein [Borreliella bissettiae]|uniref:Uncharacterized protein n=1 Tax=Borrelia bissettiae (strain DSM 17990 / CIP 109136 / DN127) TaxID=521010 RepID=G0APG1_BORBD|nr:DUF228 domain-containing protein [Borreliella bissettiae]AEL19587.1 conserved hypothetical protein [Borreliella bissettiae DN127]WKD00342.1 DUF228 domain-containing protein [Borreliella bissettiae]
MSDSIDFQKEIEKLKASKVELESQLESLKKNQVQKIVLDKLQSVTAGSYPVFESSSKFQEEGFYFSQKGGLKSSSADKFENYQALDFCYKCGVKLIVNGSHLQIARGGGNDLYGVCVDFDDFSKTGTVVPITCSFECVLITKDKTIKAEDKLIINSEGVLEKSSKNASIIHALALGPSLEFKDRRDVYGVRVLFLVKQIKDAI